MDHSKRIIEAYGRHKNLKLAAEEVGIKWQALYVQLRKLGIQITGDKSRYGSDSDRLAAMAEMEFLKLVPFAEDQNKIKFQSKFDFLVVNEKVDIKAANSRQGNKRFAAKRWMFSVKKQEFCADFIVCFAFSEDETRIFLLPCETIRMYQTISISSEKKSKSKWFQYEISGSDLSEFFKSLIEK